MRSEKLKQLVKDNTLLKFRIKDEQQFKELKDFLYALEVDLLDSDSYELMYHDALDDLHYPIFIIMGITGFFYYMKEFYDKSAYHLFLDSKNKEFDLEKDCLVEACKWPNLKKLVEGKTTTLKFRIKDAQQSKELQELLFALDVSWSPHCDNFQYRHFHLEHLAIAVNFDRVYLYYLYDDAMFDRLSSKEFDLENDCLVEEEEEEEKHVSLIIPTTVLYVNPTRKDLESLLSTAITILEHVKEKMPENKKKRLNISFAMLDEAIQCIIAAL